MTFVLTGPAAHLLDADTDDLVDGDDIAKFRAALRELGIAFHVEAGAAPPDPDWNADGHPVVPVDRGRIAALAARRDAASSSSDGALSSTSSRADAPRWRPAGDRTSRAAGRSVTVVVLDGAQRPPCPPAVGVHRVRRAISTYDGLLDLIFDRRSRDHLVAAAPGRASPVAILLVPVHLDRLEDPLVGGLRVVVEARQRR